MKQQKQVKWSIVKLMEYSGRYWKTVPLQSHDHSQNIGCTRKLEIGVIMILLTGR
jgi:hypothetical protein